MSWRAAKSLDVLLREVNTLAPNRSKKSDGTIGDAAHQASASDHNKNKAGVVCARDITHDPANGADMGVITEKLRKNPPKALKYMIFNRRICSRKNGWKWVYYGGSNAHDKHAHFSVGVGPDGQSTGPYDDTSPWGLVDDSNIGIGGIMLPDEGDEGREVEFWQRMLLRTGEKLPKYGADGKWGKEMTAAVQSSRKRLGWDPAANPRITAAHAEHLFLKAFGGERGPAGPKGDPGPAGKAGRDGVLQLPVTATITDIKAA